MKRVKRFLSVILAMTMILAMSITAFAAEGVTITINDGDNDSSTYSAYRLLVASISESSTETDENGNPIQHIAYTFEKDENGQYTNKYTSVLAEATGMEKESDIVAAIANSTDTGIRIFADAVYAGILEQGLAPEYTTTTNSFENVVPGYYLIVETSVDANDAYSLVMLDTAGKDDVNITTKESVPELTKKVKETNDSTGNTTDWQDAADYDIGDNVPFKLTGTISSTYGSYETYYYSFHDRLSEGLEFNNDVVVSVDGTAIETGYSVVTEGLDDGCSFEVRFENLKDIAAVTAESEITVEYTAKLTDKAVIGGTGNPNYAKLQYSNNPYDDSDSTPGDTAETPEDKVVVFTYELDVNKVNASGDALKGAGFTLYKYSAKAAEYVAVGEEVKGEDITTFVFAGLDDGTYKLEETTVPAGYNKADDIEFVIVTDYETESDNPLLKTITIEDKDGNAIVDANDEAVFTVANGVISTNVKNVSGVLLPSTGGIGTTIFYIVGAVLMIGAVVLLAKNKRAAK